MDYIQASAYVGNFAEDSKTSHSTLQIAIDRHDITFWQNKIFDFSSFPKFFIPSYEKTYTAWLKEKFTINLPANLMQEYGLFSLSLTQSPRVEKSWMETNDFG